MTDIPTNNIHTTPDNSFLNNIVIKHGVQAIDKGIFEEAIQRFGLTIIPELQIGEEITPAIFVQTGSEINQEIIRTALTDFPPQTFILKEKSGKLPISILDFTQVKKIVSEEVFKFEVLNSLRRLHVAGYEIALLPNNAIAKILKNIITKVIMIRRQPLEELSATDLLRTEEDEAILHEQIKYKIKPLIVAARKRSDKQTPHGPYAMIIISIKDESQKAQLPQILVNLFKLLNHPEVINPEG